MDTLINAILTVTNRLEAIAIDLVASDLDPAMIIASASTSDPVIERAGASDHWIVGNLWINAELQG